MRHAVVISFALAVSSCFSAVIERQCEKDADCGSGWRCIATVCVDQGAGVGGGTAGSGNVGGGSAVGGGGTAGGSGGTGGGNPLCNPGNCINGCCAGNVCIPTTAQNAVNCGKAGAACLSCNPGAGICKDGACFGGTCDSTTCPNGCCLQNQCVPSSVQTPNACGVGGGICMSCGAGQLCDNGTCENQPCSPTTCPSGCCAGNACIPFTQQSTSRCGNGGRACAACANNLTCSSGVCGMTTCNSTTCSGCCLGNVCVPLGAQSSTSCGRNGAACIACAMGNVCNGNGQCTPQGCGPMTCRGCCTGNQCANGNDNFACGSGGGTCQACSAGSACLNGSCQSCGPGTCSFGCCQNGFCRSGTSNNACGNGGGSCFQCSSGSSCTGQHCVTTLDAGFPDAGPRPTGAACNNNSECQPPSNAFCLPGNLAMIDTGYLGGYCSQPCSAANACPAGSVCITEAIGTTVNTTCKSLCSNPGGGQSTCRANYICITAPSGVGWCGPRCGNQSFPCPSGGTCNFSTGYCN